MRFMVMIKANKDTENGVMPDEKLLADMGKYNEELVKAGIMLAGEGLHPSSKAVRVRFDGGEAPPHDRPFARTQGPGGGFWGSPRPRSWWQASGSGRYARATRPSSGSSAPRSRAARKWRFVRSSSSRTSAP